MARTIALTTAVAFCLILPLLQHCALACPKKAVQAAAPVQLPAVYEGCYIDERAPRDMPLFAGYNPNMKRDLCETYCRKYRAKFFAMQEGIACYCGESYGRFGKADELQCAVRCVGEREERCGGVLHNSVYKIVY